MTLHASALRAALTVGDLPKSVAWYRDGAGFTVEREVERGGRVASVAMSAGEVRILLNQDDGARGLDRAKGEGVSLMIVTRQSVDEIADGIRSIGGTIVTEPADTPWGTRAFRARDPDGFLLVFSTE